MQWPGWILGNSRCKGGLEKGGSEGKPPLPLLSLALLSPRAFPNIHSRRRLDGAPRLCLTLVEFSVTFGDQI